MSSSAPFAYMFLQRKAEGRLLAEQRRYQETLLAAAKGMTRVKELNRLLRLIVHVLTKTMRLTHAAIYLYDDLAERYVLRVYRNHQPFQFIPDLEGKSALVQQLILQREPVVYEEFKRQLEDRPDHPWMREVEAQLRATHAAVVVPSFMEDVLIGFLVLGEKRSGQIFSQDDLKVLATLATQAALALENAQFYAEFERLANERKLIELGEQAAGMAHDIENPNSIIMGQAELLLSKLEDRDPQGEAVDPALVQEVKERLEKIVKAADRSHQIIKTAKEAIRATPGTFAPVDLKEVLRETLHDTQELVRQAGIELEDRLPEHLPMVMGNLVELLRVFVNLIRNAMKAMDRSPVKRLTLEAREPMVGQVEIRVADTGKGIPKEALERIFLAFISGTGLALEGKGSGLGLHNASQIVLRHKGRIWAESAGPGQGALFVVQLPTIHTDALAQAA